jgi:hypothetical protein
VDETIREGNSRRGRDGGLKLDEDMADRIAPPPPAIERGDLGGNRSSPGIDDAEAIGFPKSAMRQRNRHRDRKTRNPVADDRLHGEGHIQPLAHGASAAIPPKSGGPAAVLGQSWIRGKRRYACPKPRQGTQQRPPRGIAGAPEKSTATLL